MLEIRNLTKTYGNNIALQDVNLNIPEKSIYGLLGPNGAGKTTLIRIINRIYRADKGEVLFNGKKMMPDDIREIGYMPEERGLYQKMKVGELLMYLVRLKGFSVNDARTVLQFWLKRLNATDWWGKKVDELSKGMQQKIQFVATVAHNPRLLILDEPFSGFDPVNAQMLKDEIFRLREEGTTIIFSSHRMESVEEICSHVALINHSKIILDGKLKDIQQEHRENFFEAVISDITSDLKVSLPFEIHLTEEVRPLTVKIRFTATPGMKANEILQTLMSTGQIESFREVFPTMHDIFLKLVNSPSNAKDPVGHHA